MPAFKRKDSTSTTSSIPPEVKQYYQAEHRERVGVAWLIAFITLILTIAVVFGLFFGGRWLYRTLRHNPTTAIQQPLTAKSTSSNSSKSTKPSNKSVATNKQPASTPTTGSSTAVTSSPPQGAPSTSSSSPVASASTPTTGRSQPLANTGPGNILAIFLEVTLVSTLTHAIIKRRQAIS